MITEEQLTEVLDIHQTILEQQQLRIEELEKQMAMTAKLFEIYAPRIEALETVVAGWILEIRAARAGVQKPESKN